MSFLVSVCQVPHILDIDLQSQVLGREYMPPRSRIKAIVLVFLTDISIDVVCVPEGGLMPVIKSACDHISDNIHSKQPSTIFIKDKKITCGDIYNILTVTSLHIHPALLTDKKGCMKFLDFLKLKGFCDFLKTFTAAK